MRFVSGLLRKVGIALLAVVLLVLGLLAIKPILITLVIGIAAVIILGVLLRIIL